MVLGSVEPAVSTTSLGPKTTLVHVFGDKRNKPCTPLYVTNQFLWPLLRRCVAVASINSCGWAQQPVVLKLRFQVRGMVAALRSAPLAREVVIVFLCACGIVEPRA